MIPGSLRTFWYKGSADIQEKTASPKKQRYISKNVAYNSKYDFSKKSRYGLNMLILNRYDII